MSPTLRTLLAALLLAAPAAAAAQNGRIAGTVTDAAKAPVAAAQVSIVATRQGATTDDRGRYTITNVVPGTYEVRVQRIGQRPTTIPSVVVRAGEETRVDATLEQAPLELGGVTVSASRRVEKITDAPATVTARVEVVEVIAAKKRVRLSTTCRNQRGETVLDGEALLMVPDG